MMILSLIVIAAPGAAAVLPYPGVVATGEFRTSDGQSCSLALWKGSAIDRRLLADVEREQLDRLLEEVRQRWHDGDVRSVPLPLLRRYLDLTSPPGRTGSSPLALRTVTYGPLEGHLSRLTPGPFRRTFTRPDAAVSRDLFGREHWEPPILKGQLKDVLEAIRKALR